MMIVDTSALMAIVLQEAERDLFLAVLAAGDGIGISAATMIAKWCVSVAAERYWSRKLTH